MVIDNASVSGLITFINNYKECGVDLFETYAKGLDEDFNAVKNAILNRNISNGPIVITSKLLFPVVGHEFR